MKTAEELLEMASKIPRKRDGIGVYARFRPAAFKLRDAGYTWEEAAKIFTENGEVIDNIPSFCSSMSRAYNIEIRKLNRKALEEKEQKEAVKGK